METTTIIGWVVLGILGVTLVAALVSKAVLSFMKGPLEARIAAHYGQSEILMQDLQANSFGRESAGVWQCRGNGGLVLTAKHLHFFQFLPKRDFRVSLDAITELTLTKSHLGKATIYEMLKVHFSADGQRDSVAWYLTDPQAWKDRIEAAQPGGSL